MTNTEFRTKLAALVQSLGSQSATARKLGVSTTHVGELLRGTRAPGKKVLAGMGLKRVTSIEEEQ